MAAAALFDTHAHLAHLAEAGGCAPLLARAATAGVRWVLAVGGDATMNHAALAAAEQFPGRVWCAAGLDREFARQPEPAWAAETAALAAWARAGRLAAIGEIGLDYHYARDTAVAQRALLAQQLALARACALPVVLHCREAEADLLALLAEHRAAWPGPADRLGVLHCFAAGPAFAEAIVQLGFHVGFSGIVTFRNAAAVHAAVPAVPLDRLLLETDTPYLAPVPHRGQPNEPAFLPHIARRIADLRGCSVEAIITATTANAHRLFATGAHGENDAQ